MRYFFPLILMILVATSCDKIVISDKQKDGFVKFYGNNANDEGVDVLQTADGGYLIMGNLENQDGNKDIFIIQTDEFGNSKAPVKTYGGSSDEVAHRIKKDANGYIIAGYKQTDVGNRDVYLIQINNNGDTLWTSTFDIPRDDEAYDIIPLDNGNFALTGYTDSASDDLKRRILFMEINNKGQRINTKNKGTSEDDEAYCMMKISGGYILCGYSKGYPNATTVRNAFMLQINEHATSNAIPMAPLGSGSNSEIISITGNNGNYLVTCNSKGQLTNQNFIQLVEVGAPELGNKSIQWKKTLGEENYVSAGSTTIKGNQIYITGTSAAQGTTGNIILIRTSLQGENPDYSYIGDGASYTCNSFDFTSDGGYIFTGASHINENSVILLVKVNAQLGL